MRPYNCGVSVAASSRSEDDLTEAERRELEDVHKELRAAVSAYEAFLGTELRPGEPVVAANGTDVLEAQERVEAAEKHLWQLRERLLGWSRPPWAPPASLVADWFSTDDAIYDQVTDPPAS